MREEEQPRLLLDTSLQRRKRAPAMHRRCAQLHRVQLAAIDLVDVQTWQDATSGRKQVAHPLLGRIGRLAVRKGER